ncbi:MAG: signal peptidase [Patescibacteria group bacterium]|nr:signal peptidase [Patescibacteria group bacterium]
MNDPQSVVSQFFEISYTPFSVVFLSFFALLCILLFLGIFSKPLENFLKRIRILEEKETPLSFLKWILSVLVIIRTIQVFIAQPFLVDGTSMYPTFQDNNLLIVDKTYKYRTINRNDVLVFRFEDATSPYNNKFFIKRIIGLPGDTIRIDGTDTSIIDKNGEKVTLDESYVKYPKLDQNVNVTLGNDEYFVEGDNRSGSYDSRAWGPIHINQMAGKPILELWPRITINPGSVKD